MSRGLPLPLVYLHENLLMDDNKRFSNGEKVKYNSEQLCVYAEVRFLRSGGQGVPLPYLHLNSLIVEIKRFSMGKGKSNA